MSNHLRRRLRRWLMSTRRIWVLTTSLRSDGRQLRKRPENGRWCSTIRITRSNCERRNGNTTLRRTSFTPSRRKTRRIFGKNQKVRKGRSKHPINSCTVFHQARLRSLLHARCDSSIIQQMKSVLLIVDDEPAARFGMRRVLEKEGYTILEADNLEAAERAVEKSSPKVVLLDVRLASESGLDYLP